MSNEWGQDDGNWWGGDGRPPESPAPEPWSTMKIFVVAGATLLVIAAAVALIAIGLAVVFG